MKFSDEAQANAAFRNWRESGSHFTFKGQRIFFQQAGKGRPLLLVHGFPTASWDWIHIWNELASRYHVIAPDMLGFGWSPKPQKHAYTMVEQADLHETLLSHLGITDVAILCHDYGVSVVQEMLARYESSLAIGEIQLQLHAICFLNGGLFPEMHQPRMTQKLLISPAGALVSRLMSRRSFGRGFSEVFGPDTQPSETELDRFWELVAHNQGSRIAHLLIRYMDERRLHRSRWVQPLQTSHVPIRLVNGNLDPVSGRHLSDYYRRRVPNPDIVNLPNIGHYPQVEDPDAVLQAVLPFFARHYPTRVAETAELTT